MFIDKHDIPVKDMDIINLHQTVNGCFLFVIFSVEKLDVRYYHDLTRKYEYDARELLTCCDYNGDAEFEIIGNLFKINP